MSCSKNSNSTIASVIVAIMTVLPGHLAFKYYECYFYFISRSYKYIEIYIFLSFVAEATYEPSLPMKTKSRLSKDLQEVLHDNSALAYFIQFLDAHKAKHLVKFWLEAESFLSSFETRKNTHNSMYMNSDNNDCMLIKSKNVFHDSSQAVGQKLETKPCDEDILHMQNICVPVDSCKDISCSNNDTCTLSLSKSEQSSSVDSGCDEKMVTNSIFKGVQKCGEIGVTEHNCLVTNVNCDKTSGDSLDIDQGIEITSSKDLKSHHLKDSIVRLETSKK